MSSHSDNPPLADLERDLAALRELAAAPDDHGPDDDVLAALRTRIEADQEAEKGLLGRLRSLPTTTRRLVAGAVALGFTLLSGLLLPRPNLGQYPTLRMALILGAMAVLCGVAVWRILKPLHEPRPSATADRVLLVLGVLAPVLFACWPMPAELRHEATGTFVGRAMSCLAFGGVLGIPVLGLAVAMRRARVDGAAVAALAGVAAGLTANLGLQLHCPATDPSHILVSHASLVVLLAPAAALWRR